MPLVPLLVNCRSFTENISLLHIIVFSPCPPFICWRPFSTNDELGKRQFNPIAGIRVNLSKGGFFCSKSHPVISRMWQLFTWHCRWITWASAASDDIVISTSFFSLKVYKVNFCKSKKTDFTPAEKMAIGLMKHARTGNVDKRNCFECYSPQRSK